MQAGNSRCPAGLDGSQSDPSDPLFTHDPEDAQMTSQLAFLLAQQTIADLDRRAGQERPSQGTTDNDGRPRRGHSQSVLNRLGTRILAALTLAS